MFTLSIKPTWYVPQDSVIVVSLPTDVKSNNEWNTESNCGETTLTGFSSRDIDCKIRSTYTVRAEDGFRDSASSGDPPTLKFDLPNMLNPRSTQPTGAFDVYIEDSNGETIYTWTDDTSPTLTMITSVKPLAISFTRLSK